MEEQDNKEKLLKGAEDLFLTNGVRSITMDDIARHLGISKKTIYQHFEDKDEIVALVLRSHMERQRHQFDEIASKSKNAVEEMVRLSVLLKESMRNVNASLLFELQKYHQRAWNTWLEFKRKDIHQSIIRNMRQGIAEGYFRNDINVDVLGRMRLEMVQMAFDNMVFPRESFNLSEVQAQLFDHFVHGLLTDKGKKLYQKYKEQLTEGLSNP